MMYRAQANIVEENLGDYKENFKKIASLLEEFCMVNPSCHQACDMDHDGCYKRAFISNPYISRHVQHGQRVLGIDGAFMKHGVYSEVMLILVGRTGNNTNIILAVALCPTEDEENWRWFLEHARVAGVKFDGIPGFSDRGHGLLAALESSRLGCHSFNICVPMDLKTMVYRIQASDTEDECKSHLGSLSLTHPQIARYLVRIQPERWLMHPPVAQATKMYGWRTTNFVESANGAAITARSKFPLHFFMDYMDKFMNEVLKCQEQGEAWKRQGLVVTPYADDKIGEQQRLSSLYTVLRKSASVAFVRSTRGFFTQQRVDLDSKSCTCSYMGQKGLPCRHFIAALIKCDRLIELYDACDQCYKVDVFFNAYGCGDRFGVELVLNENIEVRDAMPPPRTLNNVGQKKTKRFASHQELPLGAPSVKLRRCTLCGDAGHNRRSCLSF
ncbi:hypothetical protein LEN26_013233 [Aphanomyces euteiches]|nr:hypothetical protein LEN26_013233 [Aphanomyces euteiches]